MTCETSLIDALSGLSSVDGDAGLGEDGLEYQLYLSARPFLGQGELGLVVAFLVGNTLGRGLAVETHAILVGAEALQLPAGGNANLRLLTGAAAVAALKVPLHHVVAARAAEVETLGVLRSCGAK